MKITHSGTKRWFAAGSQSAQLKRLLYAAAVALSSDAAFAQSNVTLYGVIDTSIEVTDTGNHVTTRMDSGSLLGSQFGIKGREDLGSGTYIDFQLEDGFNSQNGHAADSTLAFSRQAWVGVSGDWGDLRFGRQHSPIYANVAPMLDAFGVVGMGSGFNNFITITPRANNSVRYETPIMYGFKAQGMVSLRDSTTDPTNGVNDYFLGVEYANGGPINSAGGVERSHAPTDNAVTQDEFYGISYGIKKVRAFFALEHAAIGQRLARNLVSLSARYMPTPADSIAAGYSYARDTTSAHNDGQQIGMLYQHFLSVRTTVYAGAAYLWNRRKATFTLNGATVTGIPADYPGAPIRGIQLGLMHKF
jgi:predicted porin